MSAMNYEKRLTKLERLTHFHRLVKQSNIFINEFDKRRERSFTSKNLFYTFIMNNH